ncbi:MAG TPA: molybdopterin-dependent oxidoreductase [Burkholderiaceae bacterium]|nr:molybdopterin-dependent oxidoreductase [Burkholderiaceae bacterium]
MMLRTAPRRGFLAVWALAALAAAASTPAALALDAPAGKVVLTVGGKLKTANDGDAASFDLALLQTLPQHSFSTRTPWYAQPRKFTGVLLRDLLAGLGAAPGATLRAVALNDYRVDIPADDVARHGALLAYLLDDQPMSVRERGPLVIIYPFDDRPELRTAVHYGRAIWQLRSLEVK